MGGVGEGAFTNGQLVTQPTSFLKLGHRRETGTAELSPNRTVAHLVPGPSGTPGRGGGGEAGGCCPEASEGNLKFRSREVISLLSVLTPNCPLPSGSVQTLESGESSPT